VSGPPILEDSERGLLLRPLVPGDRSAVIAMLAEPGVARWWGVYEEPADGGLFEEPEAGDLVWAIELDSEFAGVLMAAQEDTPAYRSAGLDISLVTAVQGRGLGPAALRMAINWLRDERGHHRFTIDPNRQNERAISAYSKVGFEPVGVTRASERLRDGSYADSLLMELVEFPGA
jgi:aminoglycoside 6'-N-acetyltransferase